MQARTSTTDLRSAPLVGTEIDVKTHRVQTEKSTNGAATRDLDGVRLRGFETLLDKEWSRCCQRRDDRGDQFEVEQPCRDPLEALRRTAGDHTCVTEGQSNAHALYDDGPAFPSSLEDDLGERVADCARPDRQPSDFPPHRTTAHVTPAT